MKSNIFISGVSSWIWNHLAKQLKDEFNIYWVSRRNPEIGWIDFSSLDLTDINESLKYIESKKDIGFDVMIFNAWIGYFDKFENMKTEEILSTINLNTISPIIFLNAMLPTISPKAKLIFIWSVASKKFFKHWAVYQASKFALRWFAGSLKNELKQKIYLINPSIADTGFFANNRLGDSAVDHFQTSLDSISDTIKDIISWKENRFEIDL